MQLNLDHGIESYVVMISYLFFSRRTMLLFLVYHLVMLSQVIKNNKFIVELIDQVCQAQYSIVMMFSLVCIR